MGRQQPRPQQPGSAGVMVLCTYCGSLSIRTDKCSNCNGHFDLLSRQRTQNGMGPWFIRDQVNPFHPGCSYETLRRLIARGRVRPDTVMRGPTTRQFWSFARNTPGVAHLLGACHACHVAVDSAAHACPSCNASFIVADDRQQLGLAPIQMLPGDADPSAVADAAFGPVGSSVPAPFSSDVIGDASHSQASAKAPASQATGRSESTTVAAARPIRKRSSGPMVAVVASVGCAVIALAAVVYMNRADATTGLAVASENKAGQIPTSPNSQSQPVPQETLNTSPVIDDATFHNPAASSEDLGTGQAVPGGEDSRASEADDAPADLTERPDLQVRPPESDTPDSGAQYSSVTGAAMHAAVIGKMTASELAEVRVSWMANGRKSLVEAVDRRIQQLQLRALFTAE